jgi:hypothetical protein
MRGVTLLLDRTAVLFLGIAAGAAIGYSFGDDRTPSAAAAPAPMSKPAALQQAAAAGSECALPFQPQLLSRVAEGGKVRVGVFGDRIDAVPEAVPEHADAHLSPLRHARQFRGREVQPAGDRLHAI